MANSYLGQILIVGAGGFIGSSLRFAIGGVVQRLAMFTTFPLGTLEKVEIRFYRSRQ